MIAIGGKTKKAARPAQPQYVVRAAAHVNTYALFRTDDNGLVHISWIGDPNAATKFDSKYQAKSRTREIEDVPATRVFEVL